MVTRLQSLLAFVVTTSVVVGCADPGVSDLSGAGANASSKSATKTSSSSSSSASSSSGAPTSNNNAVAKPGTPKTVAPPSSSGASSPDTNADSGTCANPQCFCTDDGECGCLGGDAQLGCQDGVCGCFTGFELQNDEGFEATCQSEDDAANLFLGQCQCNDD